MRKHSNFYWVLLLMLCIQIVSFAFIFIALFKVDTPIYQFPQKIKAVTDSTMILQAKVDLLEKHESWMLAVMGLSFTLIAVSLSILQYIFTKRAEENIYGELAKIAEKNKVAFKEAVKMKTIELELMNNYPIYIIESSHDLNSDKPEKLYKLLQGYSFREVYKPLVFEAAIQEKFDNKSILLCCELKPDELEKLTMDFPNAGFLLYSSSRYDKLGKELILGYANSYPTVYNNLISLLHYIRYNNKIS